MTLQFAITKDQLPMDSDLQCPICLEDINLDEIKDGTPNCVICNNGHRIHNDCFKSSTKNECPVCKNDKIRYCKSSLGYSYATRKGGKKNKNRTHKRKIHKRKTHQKRKTYKRKNN